MKIRQTMMMAALLSTPAIAQEDMPTVWTTDLDHKCQYTGIGDFGAKDYKANGISYGASDKEITVFENETGKILWSKPYKEIAPNLRKIDDLYPFWQSASIFLFDRKLGKDQVACIDLKTGALLWSSDKYQNLTDDNVIYIPEREAFCVTTKEALHFIKARTGEEVWSTDKFHGVVGKYVFTPDGNVVMVNFMPSLISAMFSGFKNEIAKVNLDNGDIIWTTDYIGRAERKVVTKQFLYNLKVEDDKVILELGGLQVYDYKTGAKLWSAAFDFTPDGVASAPAHAWAFGVYGAVAKPVVVGDDIYVLDCQNRRKQFIKKYDRYTGKLEWTSPEIPDAKAIPSLYVEGDKVLLQIGGRVETQAHLHWNETTSTGTTVHDVLQVKYVDVKPYGIKAFNAGDGSMAWESERFKKGITNGIVADHKLYVCSGKALYGMNCADGKELYEVLLKDDNISDPSVILPYQDKIAVVGEKGVSTHTASDGKLVNSGKYKSADLFDYHDNIVLMQTDNQDIAAFDLNTCKYLQYNARTGAMNSLSNDGNFVYTFEKKDVTKLKTH